MAKFYVCEHCKNVVFKASDSGVSVYAVYAYCNLHSLWMAE